MLGHFYFQIGAKFERFGNVQPSERTNVIILTDFKAMQRLYQPRVCDKHVCEHKSSPVLLRRFPSHSWSWISLRPYFVNGLAMFWVVLWIQASLANDGATWKFLHATTPAREQGQTRLDVNMYYRMNSTSI